MCFILHSELKFILIIGLNYLLIPIYGIEGAAIASVAVMFLFNLVKYLFLKIKLGFEPFSYETLKIIFVGFTALIPAYFISASLSPIPNIILTSLLVLGLYLFFSRLLGVGTEEWEWVKNKIKKSGS